MSCYNESHTYFKNDNIKSHFEYAETFFNIQQTDEHLLVENSLFFQFHNNKCLKTFTDFWKKQKQQ